VCVIDALHLQHGSDAQQGRLPAEGAYHLLAWLGTAENVLAVAIGLRIHLISLRLLSQASQRHGSIPYKIESSLTVDQVPVAIVSDAEFSLVFSTTRSGICCFARSGRATNQPEALRASWSRPTPSEHALLDACTADHSVLVASGSLRRPEIAVRRTTASKRGTPIQEPEDDEWLQVPCPSTALQFRPQNTMADGLNGRKAPPTLLVVGTDGQLRLWVEHDFCSLAQSLAMVAKSNGIRRNHVMCLVHVLTPPSLLPFASPHIVATWAQASDASISACGHSPTYWIVATVYGDAADATEARFGIDSQMDALFVWTVTVAGSSADRGASGPAFGAGESEETLVSATCASPRVSVSLWGCDVHKARSSGPMSLHRRETQIAFSHTCAACSCSMTHNGIHYSM
jgi:hypothetical protein